VPLKPHDDRATASQYAALDFWRCSFPYVTPLGDRFALCLIHLRPIKGEPPAVLDFATATHEVSLYAVSPDTRADQWARGEWGPMLPVNYRYQFKTLHDRAAYWICERAAEALVNGRFPIEPGGIRGARELFAGCVREWVAQARSVFDSRGPK
jgi:hypothetical protein